MRRRVMRGRTATQMVTQMVMQMVMQMVTQMVRRTRERAVLAGQMIRATPGLAMLTRRAQGRRRPMMRKTRTPPGYRGLPRERLGRR